MQISTRVRAFLVENFLFGSTDSLKDDTSFMEEGIIDSTGILELVFFLEETFGIHIEDEELIPENMDSIHNIERFVTRKLDPDSAVVQ